MFKLKKHVILELDGKIPNLISKPFVYESSPRKDGDVSSELWQDEHSGSTFGRYLNILLLTG